MSMDTWMEWSISATTDQAAIIQFTSTTDSAADIEFCTSSATAPSLLPGLLSTRRRRNMLLSKSAANADRAEGYILCQLTQSLEDKPSLLPVVLDRFDLTGPNGNHRCLVTLPARCSLRAAREASGSCLFQLDVARSLAAQLAMAVSLVHSQGYAHGGEHPVVSTTDNSADIVL